MAIISPSNHKITDLSSESSLSTSTHTSMSSNEQDSSAVLVYPHKKQQTQDLIDIYQPIGHCNDQHKVDLDEDADGNIFATFHLNSMDSIRLPANSNTRLRPITKPITTQLRMRQRLAMRALSLHFQTGQAFWTGI